MHRGPPLGVRREQGVDQGLVVPPGALAGADAVGVVAEEAQVDHPLMVGAGPGGAAPHPAAPGREDAPHPACGWGASWWSGVLHQAVGTVSVATPTRKLSGTAPGAPRVVLRNSAAAGETSTLVPVRIALPELSTVMGSSVVPFRLNSGKDAAARVPLTETSANRMAGLLGTTTKFSSEMTFSPAVSEMPDPWWKIAPWTNGR